MTIRPRALLFGGLISTALWITACVAVTHAAWQQDVRVTHYLLRGTTYSGLPTAPGVAACSWNIPLYSQVIFPGGEVVTCLDRGILGASGWLDIWVASPAEGAWWAARYGDWTTVTILPAED